MLAGDRGEVPADRRATSPRRLAALLLLTALLGVEAAHGGTLEMTRISLSRSTTSLRIESEDPKLLAGLAAVKAGDVAPTEGILLHARGARIRHWKIDTAAPSSDTSAGRVALEIGLVSWPREEDLEVEVWSDVLLSGPVGTFTVPWQALPAFADTESPSKVSVGKGKTLEFVWDQEKERVAIPPIPVSGRWIPKVRQRLRLEFFVDAGSPTAPEGLKAKFGESWGGLDPYGSALAYDLSLQTGFDFRRTRATLEARRSWLLHENTQGRDSPAKGLSTFRTQLKFSGAWGGIDVDGESIERAQAEVRVVAGWKSPHRLVPRKLTLTFTPTLDRRTDFTRSLKAVLDFRPPAFLDFLDPSDFQVIYLDGALDFDLRDIDKKILLALRKKL